MIALKELATLMRVASCRRDNKGASLASPTYPLGILMEYCSG